MPDYIYLLENRLSPDQRNALRLLRESAREAEMILFLTGDAVRDLTSGHETYAASRFLDSKIGPDGKVVLDFNEAYNPPCAYNPYTTCPLPPPENRLDVRIAAGEKIHHHAE